VSGLLGIGLILVVWIILVEWRLHTTIRILESMEEVIMKLLDHVMEEETGVSKDEEMKARGKE